LWDKYYKYLWKVYDFNAENEEEMKKKVVIMEKTIPFDNNSFLNIDNFYEFKWLDFFIQFLEKIKDIKEEQKKEQEINSYLLDFFV